MTLVREIRPLQGHEIFFQKDQLANNQKKMLEERDCWSFFLVTINIILLKQFHEI